MNSKRTIASIGLALAIASTAPADMFKPSKGDQVKLGLRAANDIRRKERVLSDRDPRVQLVRDVAYRLLAASPDTAKEPWQFSFDVIDNKAVNAFALPGGPIFFYTGLLDKFKTEDQLAAVLAHEITHVRKEHWARAYADQQKRSLGLSVLLMIFNANKTVANIASISNDLLLTLPYMRRDETQADEVGFDMMVRAGYNPHGMADVFEILRASSRGGKPPEFLSTHPDDRHRIQRIENKIERSGRTFSAQRPIRYDGR
jgi:beta-barrel assembly-enhancing protease